MPDEVSILDRRSLTRLFPALRLVGAIRQAFDLRKLIIAALGLAILQAGWSGSRPAGSGGGRHHARRVRACRRTESLSEPDFWSWETVSGLHLRLSEPVRLLATPLFGFVEPGAGWARMLHAISSLIWLIAVWGICGGAISRIAIVQAAAVRQTGIIDALRFALANAQPLIVAPLCPLLAWSSLPSSTRHLVFFTEYRRSGPHWRALVSYFRSRLDW